MAKHNDTPAPRLAKSKTCHQRIIKVNQSYYLYRRKTDHTGTGRPVPWIQLKGLWLLEAGFNIDSPIKVRVMEGCLVLTVGDGE